MLPFGSGFGQGTMQRPLGGLLSPVQAGGYATQGANLGNVGNPFTANLPAQQQSLAAQPQGYSTQSAGGNNPFANLAGQTPIAAQAQGYANQSANLGPANPFANLGSQQPMMQQQLQYGGIGSVPGMGGGGAYGPGQNNPYWPGSTAAYGGYSSQGQPNAMAPGQYAGFPPWLGGGGS